MKRLARQATTHCMTGCATGEVSGMVVAGLAGWPAGPSIDISVALAFVFGYALTIWPLVRSGVTFRAAVGLAFAADTVSVVVMEAIDNLTIVIIPGAMSAGLGDPLFWATLLGGFVLGWGTTYPVNRWLIRRGRGHALVHGVH